MANLDLHGRRLYPDQGISADNGGNRLFNLYRDRLRSREGGRNIDDPRGGPTNLGMSQAELDRLIAREEKAGKGTRWSMPRDVMKLTDRQITDIFLNEYFKRLNVQKIAHIPGLTDQAPALPELMFDAGIHHGISDPAKWLQKALNDALAVEADPDDRSSRSKPRLDVDGIVGSATLAALTEAARLGKINDVSDAVVRDRLEYAKALSNAAGNRGWIPRIESFLSENYRSKHQ